MYLSVIVIIIILLALMLPAVQTVRANARSGQCLNNLRQLTLTFKKAQVNLGTALRIKDGSIVDDFAVFRRYMDQNLDEAGV